ncbi:MAPEG family protein [Cyanobium sp. ATX 6A2]|uniref:MAPEG family protein n=1 Tax=Cyanobium sp. ATX 6A2 TaxID=2823700 RepID=UPI0020CF7BDB|nr:MAPEG family protein [Cyanobium sp. ATX 6A2]MCP9886678.1 MAPEG family protein [Cyanobium sp. ATX 6A2]
MPIPLPVLPPLVPALPALVTLLALLLYLATVMLVGRARFRHGIKPPASDGPEPFLRALRVQQNTLEQLVFFLPSLWLAALFASESWASLLGFIWVGARVAYAVGYLQAPEKRGPGFGISLLAGVALWLVALAGVLNALTA